LTPFYVAGALLVVAQILGIYALVSRKADFVFAGIMIVLVVVPWPREPTASTASCTEAAASGPT